MLAPARTLRRSTPMLWAWTGTLFLCLFPPSPILLVVLQKMKHIPGHCRSLALPVMVPWLNQCFCRSSPLSSTDVQSIFWFRTPAVFGSPQPGLVPIPRLSVVWAHLQTEGFSARTANWIALPQRDSTGHLSLVPSMESTSCHSHCASSGGVPRTLVSANSYEPCFFAKNKKTQDSMPRIITPGLWPTVGDHPDRELCPVMALKAYLNRTKDYLGARPDFSTWNIVLNKVKHVTINYWVWKEIAVYTC